MINPKSGIRSMTNQQLRADFRETQLQPFGKSYVEDLTKKIKLLLVQSVARGTICDDMKCDRG